MNLTFFAVFAACACFVNGHYHFYNSLRILESEEQTPATESWADDENSTGEITNDVDLETSTSANDEVILEDKHFKYWPQVVIIKPMENRPMPFSLGNLLPNANMFGPPRGNPNVQGFTTKKVIINRPRPGMKAMKKFKPITFTTFSTTTHHSFSTHGPEKKVTTTPTVLPHAEAREHETDAEIAAQNQAENTESEPELETEASSETIPTSESPSNELFGESPEIEETAETQHHSTETQHHITENSCPTPSGGSGECISLFNCPVLLGLVNKKDRTTQDIDLLKRSQCGYQGTAPAVCCPKQTPTQTPQGNCYTPEGNVGQCISLYSCAHLANMLRPPVPNENIAYVQKSKCEGPEQYSVCCGPPPDRNNQNMVVPSGNCNAHMTAYPPDPRTECCGVDSRVGNKIVGGNATTVDQYPWLVMIEYVQAGVTKLLCGGVLISGKYVLTAGHCVAGQVLTIGTPKRVRLGEYNISHEGADCAPVEAGGEDCTEGVTRILIEKVIPHPQYNPVSALKRNDIALLRLKEVAPFTDFIRPICLPTKDLTEPSNIPTNFSLYAAGWGAVSDRKSYSEVKLHVELPYVNPDKCQPVYSFPGRSVPLWKAQLCAGGVTGKDSCKGDSGGPLMYENGRTYEVIGIVSFGPVPCGMDGVPGVYSKVYEYLDWIRSTIVP